MKYGLLWLLGVPIPVLIVLYLLFHSSGWRQGAKRGYSRAYEAP